MKQKAYAKINLSLDVFNIREDGYHDLKSVMVPIDFYDVVDIKISKENNYYCDKSYIRWDENNSILKMIKLFQDKYDINDNYTISLNKVVPTQAGLGGGTADGAAALKILQQTYGITMSKEEIKEMCMGVGADVLFNYYNKPAIVTGVGDGLEFFDIKDKYNVLLIKPKFGVSTKQSFELLNMETCDHPDIDKLKEALEKGNDITGLLGNSLEEPSIELNKDIQRIKDTLKELGVKNVLMSGSGSTVFVIDKDETFINHIYYEFKKVKHSSDFVRQTRIIKVGSVFY